MIESEQIIIGCISYDFSMCAGVLDVLEPKHFSGHFCREMFNTCLAMREEKIAIDETTLFVNGKKRGAFKNSFGEEDLEKVVDIAHWRNSAIPHHWKNYAKEILNDYAKKEAEKMASGLSQSLEKGTPLVDILNETKNKIESLSRAIEIEERKDAHSILSKMYDEYDEMDRGLISTGYRDFDSNLKGGFNKNDLVILAARPAMGKTAFAINICMNASKKGLSTAFISLEMPKEDVAKRMMSCDGGIKYDDLTKSEGFGPWLDEIKKRKIFINDKTLSSLNGIRSYISELKNKESLDIVFIDYLQLISIKTGKSRYEQVSEISRALKVICLEFDITIIALSQLSRKVEERKPPIPQLSDLRDSGSLEQDADKVIMMMRPNYYDPKQPRKECNIYIRKNRHGEAGFFELEFDGEYMKFSNPKK